MLHIATLLSAFATIALCARPDNKHSTRHQDLPFFDSFALLHDSMGPVSSYIAGYRGTSHERVQLARQYQRSRKAEKDSKPDVSEKQSVVCPHSVGGYHVITSAHYISPEVGALECGRHGWQYAVVPDEAWHPAAWTIQNCTYLSIGVRSYNGFMTSGCQLMQGAGGFLISQDAYECANLLSFPLLCKEGPVEISQETVFEDYTTTTTTIVTVTTPDLDPETTTTAPEKQRNTVKSHKSINKQKLASSRKAVKGKLQNGYDVCPSSYSGLHMVYDPFSHGDSYQVCEDLGMALADIDAENSDDLLALFDECQPYDVIFNVNSYSGIASGLCRLAYVLPWYNVWGLVGVNPSMCMFLDAPVLCQDVPFTATATAGTAVDSTVLMTMTTVDLVPVATETVTETTYV